jgi:hypothetical protein
MFWDLKPYRQTRKDTVLEEGIISLDGTTGVYKVGDGVTPWAELVEFRPVYSAGGGALLFGLGAPVDANGNDGDVYIRKDGGTETTIYQRRAGGWVGIV